MKPWAAVCRFGGVGDNLIVSSVLPLLARTHRVEVITQVPQGVLFENNPHIEKLTVFPDHHLPFEGGEQWQSWFRKRAVEYDRFYHLSHSIETTIALVPGQTHYNWSASMRRKWCDHSYLAVAHDVCEVPHEYEPRFFPTEAEAARAATTKREAMGEPLIGWVLSGSRMDKTYPYSAMAVVRLLREVEGAHVMMVGSTGREFAMAKTILEHVQRENCAHNRLHLALSPGVGNDGKIIDPPFEGAAVPAEPSWPLRRSLSQMQVCDIVVGPDTGLMWSVASRPMPKIMLLSHASPRNITFGWQNTTTLHADRTRVPCWPCHRLITDYEADCTTSPDKLGCACISDITVEEIIVSTKNALRRARPGNNALDFAGGRAMVAAE